MLSLIKVLQVLVAVWSTNSDEVIIFPLFVIITICVMFILELENKNVKIEIVNTVQI